MARPQEFNRPQVVQAALHVFWRDGYESSSINKLLDATNLSRGSLYGAFGDKEGLFHEVLDCYFDYQMDHVELSSKGKDDPIMVITNFFESFALYEDAEIRERGCLVFNTIAELSHTRPHLAKASEAKLNNLRDLLVFRLDQANVNNLIRKDKTIEQLADYLIALGSGLRMHCKLKTDPAIMREIIDIGMEVLMEPEGLDNCVKFQGRNRTSLN